MIEYLRSVGSTLWWILFTLGWVGCAGAVCHFLRLWTMPQMRRKP